MTKYAISILVALICACSAPKSVVLNQKYANDAPPDYRKINEKCQYIITDIQDNRKDKQSLGNLYFTHVSSEDVMQWLRNGLAAAGFETVAEPLRAADAVNITVELILANVKSSSTSLATNLVVGVNFRDKDKTIYLRGLNCAIDWSSSQEGIQASFDASLQEVLAKLIELSEASCSSWEAMAR